MSDDFNIEKPKSNLREKYRLAVIDEENLKEVKSFRVSLLNIYTLLSGMILLLGFIIVSLIFFTPLKRWVPGFGDVHESYEYQELRTKVTSLEENYTNQELYIESLKKLIRGEISEDIELTQKDLPQENKPAQTKLIKAGPSPAQKSIRELDQLLFVTPVSGQVTDGFLSVDDHLGVDVLAAADTPIKSILEGIVVFSDWTLETGNTISIQHANNTLSLYKHNSALLSKVGDRVEAGQAIAIIGNTGTLSDGPHLHFELWYDGFPVDPEKYINFN